MSTFWDSRVIQSVKFNSQFGMSIRQLDNNDSEPNECQWQQRDMASRIFEVNVTIGINRMRNCFSKLR
jgi:hypothetical protein